MRCLFILSWLLLLSLVEAASLKAGAASLKAGAASLKAGAASLKAGAASLKAGAASLKEAAQCTSLEPLIKQATHRFLKEYPYWYNVGLAEVETRCRWVQSLDGHGSVGYFQLTPKFLDHILRPYFPKYKEPHLDHFYAFAFYLKSLYDTTPVKKLWVVYQRYNGGGWVLRECGMANSYVWEHCRSKCRRGNVCVWRGIDGCKQYRSACDINYEYSVKVYKSGLKYKKEEDKYDYW